MAGRLGSFLVLAGAPVLVFAGEPPSCADEHGMEAKIENGTVDNQTLGQYLQCLASNQRDMVPEGIQWLSEQAGGEEFDDCEDVVEAVGCNLDLTDFAHALFGVNMTVMSGDLCVKTCSTPAAGSCAAELGMEERIHNGTVDAQVIGGYMHCLSSKHRDMVPEGIEWMSNQSGGEVYDDCEAAVEAVGCNYNVSGLVQQVLGVHMDVKLGQLCVLTCSNASSGGPPAPVDCNQQYKVRRMLKQGTLTKNTTVAYVTCLSNAGQNMHHKAVKRLTRMAKRAMNTGKVHKDCEELIAEDGCNEDYTAIIEHLFNFTVPVKSGDICAKTCANSTGLLSMKTSLRGVKRH